MTLTPEIRKQLVEYVATRKTDGAWELVDFVGDLNAIYDGKLSRHEAESIVIDALPRRRDLSREAFGEARLIEAAFRESPDREKDFEAIRDAYRLERDGYKDEDEERQNYEFFSEYVPTGLHELLLALDPNSDAFKQTFHRHFQKRTEPEAAPEALDLLPMPKFPGYSVDSWGVPFADKKRGRAGGKMKLQKFFYKTKAGKTRFVARYRLRVGDKRFNVSAKYLQQARLFAEMNARNQTVETIEDFIVSDGA